MRTKPTLIPLLMSMALVDPDLYRFLHQQFKLSDTINCARLSYNKKKEYNVIIT